MQDLKMKFNKEIERLKSTQYKMKMEFKNGTAQLGNLRESFTNRVVAKTIMSNAGGVTIPDLNISVSEAK